MTHRFDRFALTTVVLSVTALLAACSSSATSTPSSAPPSGPTVKVGAILDLSKGWTSLGNQSKAALELAAKQQKETSGTTVDIRIEDAAGDAQKAADAVTTLADAGYTIIVGPGPSSEAQAAAEVANARGVVLISPGSTASALSVDDQLLRFVPNDKIEAQAIVALMAQQGIATVVPVWRQDLGNQGLHDSVTAAWSAAKGADAVTAGVSYPATQTDGFDQVATQVNGAVTAASTKGPVAVYLAGFGEAANLFTALPAPASTVPWYGGDGLVGTPEFATNTTIAAAAQKVCLPSPQYGLYPEQKATWQPVLDVLKAANQGQADAFGVVAYDAANAAIKVLAGSGAGKTGADLTKAVVAYADSTSGASGPLNLTPEGDRTTGPYDYWRLMTKDSTTTWAVAGGWEPGQGGNGTVVTSPACS